jgi:hypothetical protein
MRPRLLVGFLAALILSCAIVALAQPKKGGQRDTPRDHDEKAAVKNGDRAADRPESPPASHATSADDLGAPPPRASGDKAETKLSPLNPGPGEFPDAGAAPPPPEFDRLLGDIAALRSRVAALTTTLFASKLRVVVETRSGDARIASLSVTLDDGVVFTAPERFSAEDEQVVYAHAVAPGHHVVGVEVERYDARGREYRTWQSSKFSLVIPENKLVEAHLILEDDSDMAVDFPDDQDGEYELKIRLRARVTR